MALPSKHALTPAIVAVLSFALVGCPKYQLDQLPDSQLLTQPQPIAASGVYSHSPSGFACPEAVNGFRRVALLRYDTEGLHVSGGYNGGTQSCPIAVTLYVYPAPRMNFIGADAAVVQSLES